MMTLIDDWLGELRTRRRARRHIRLVESGRRRRRKMGGTRFVCVTGSSGKTTATKLTWHLLGQAPKAQLSFLSNGTAGIAKQLRKMPTDTEVVVAEVAEWVPEYFTFRDSIDLARPDVGIVISAGSDHYKVFRGPDGAAREMGKLVEAIQAGGLAILNYDDPHVLALGKLARARVATFGTAEDADYRATAIGPSSSALEFVCQHLDDSFSVRLPLLGRHFVASALAAIACASELGVPIPTIRERCSSFEPIHGRCSLRARPGGPVFICDTEKAPAWSLEFAFSVLDLFSDAPRRTIVIGTISDYPGDSRRTYRRAYREASRHADRVVLVDRNGHYANPPAEDLASGRAMIFEKAADLIWQLQNTAIPGEVILLKGSVRADHLDRIALDFEEPVACWVDGCGRTHSCLRCLRLRDPAPDQFKALKRLRRKYFTKADI